MLPEVVLPAAVPGTPRGGGKPGVRKLYVLQADIERFGPIAGCKACENILVFGKAGRAHTMECTERVKEELERRTELQARVEAYKLRVGEVDPREQGGDREARVEVGQEERGAEASAREVEEPERGITRARSSGEPTIEWPSAKPRIEPKTGTKRQSETDVQQLDPRLEGNTVEDEPEPATGEGAGGTASGSASSSTMPPLTTLDFGCGKNELIEVYADKISEAYRNSGDELNLLELQELTRLSVEISGVDVAELYSPKRYCAMASTVGLKPGISADLAEYKSNGERWDLRREDDVREWFEALEREDPYIFVGSPPCTEFSQLQALNKNKRDPETMQASYEEAKKHLWVACKSYKRQMARGRYFLHEHPHGASSWHEPEVEDILRKEGVLRVTGDMCRWGLKAEASGGPDHGDERLR